MARLEEVVELLRNSPEIAAALRDSVVAVESRPALADAAYRQGLATVAQVQEAFRDRAYLETLLLLNVAPSGLAAKLLRRLGRPRDLDDPVNLRDELREEAARARRHPADVDWEIIDNPGGPIKEQGGPWEDALDATGALGRMTPETFKTFDFFDAGSGLATSAKTLDMQAFGYLDRPSRIFGQLRHYVDQVDQFDFDQIGDMALERSEIATRRMSVAAPLATSLEQIVQIQRAIDYAAALGVEMEVKFVK